MIPEIGILSNIKGKLRVNLRLFRGELTRSCYSRDYAEFIVKLKDKNSG